MSDADDVMYAHMLFGEQAPTEGLGGDRPMPPPSEVQRAATAGDAREEKNAMRGPAITPEERERWMLYVGPPAATLIIKRLLRALDAADALAAAAERVAPTLRSDEHSHGNTQAECPFPLCRALAAYRALVAPGRATP